MNRKIWDNPGCTMKVAVRDGKFINVYFRERDHFGNCYWRAETTPRSKEQAILALVESIGYSEVENEES